MLTFPCRMSVHFSLLVFFFNANTCSNYPFFRINFGRKIRNVTSRWRGWKWKMKILYLLIRVCYKRENHILDARLIKSFWLFLMGFDLLKANIFFEHLLKLLLLSPYIISILVIKELKPSKVNLIITEIRSARARVPIQVMIPPKLSQLTIAYNPHNLKSK